MTALRVGSLCTGYGGLDLAVHAVLGGELVWVSEIDRHANLLLSHRWPGVPNLGDLTVARWEDMPPVDVLTGGFPCQPVSTAGRRRGTDDERWLFDDIAAAVGRMDPRPRLCVFENVAGLLSANSGDAMARVVHGLAALGYVGAWRVVRASDVGACHQRARVFVVAALADPGGAGAGRDGRGASGAQEPARRRQPDHAHPPVAGGTTSADPSGQRHGRGQNARGVGHVDADDEGQAWQRQRARQIAGDRSATDAPHAESARRERVGSARGRRGNAEHDGREAAADADGRGLEVSSERYGHQTPGTADGRASRNHTHRLDPAAWGDYAAAIARHEHVLGRPAPAPTDQRGRLNPAFVEWMMMLPEGWVTAVPGLSRTAQLRLLGNGVVPPQAAAAIAGLLPAILERSEAAA